MATIVDYQYIPEVSTLDALHNLASDTTNWYSQDLPWVNTFLINWANQIINMPEWEGWTWIAGWSTNVSWSASDYNTVAWGSGSIYLPDWTTLSVSSGNTGNMSTTTYIYYDMENNVVSYTTSAQSSVWDKKLLLCVAKPTSSWKKAEFQAFGTDAQSTFITADNIAANTITWNEIYANSITSNELNVSYLSAISANLGNITAWDITWTTITAWSTSSAWIKLYPYSSSQWRIEVYYGWSVVWGIRWASLLWDDLIQIIWWSGWSGYIGLSWNVLCAWKLRIPVWTDLY